MIEVAVHEAKARLSELLNAVAQGEQVTITRRGVPVGWLVGAIAPKRSRSTQRRRVDSVIVSLREQRRGVVCEGDLRTLIDEGRD